MSLCSAERDQHGSERAGRSDGSCAPPRSTPACSAWSARCCSSGSASTSTPRFRPARAVPDAAQPVESVVQTSSIAVMATGMVLIIVMRHIDLSVGSILGFVATIIGVAQVRFLPVYLGLDNPAIWIIAVVMRLGGRRGDRRLPRLPRRLSRHSRLHRHARRPLFWRGAAWWVTPARRSRRWTTASS